jgi:hypothetical protein
MATVLSSHASDDATGVTWPQCDVDVESCWWRCCRVMLTTAIPGRFCHDAMYMSSHATMVLPSHAGDGAAGRFGYGVMYMPSHAGDGATKSC